MAAIQISILYVNFRAQVKKIVIERYEQKIYLQKKEKLLLKKIKLRWRAQFETPRRRLDP